MGALDGRVVIVTGAGRGLGRAYALTIAAEGARVVVDDVGCQSDGTGTDPSVAQATVDDIVGAGGAAVARTDDVRTVAGAQALLDATLEAYGEVHGLVNNAGVLRDRMFVNMSEEEWDDVIAGQLKATFCPSRILAGHWRDRSKAGDAVAASIVNVSSTSGLLGQPGQTNYGAAKAGIAALSVILAQELGRYGVRVNALTPVARTRMTEDLPGVKDLVAAPADPDAFDVYAPAGPAPLVAWLLTEGCAATGQTFYAKGGEIRHFLGWHYGGTVKQDGPFTVADLHRDLPGLLADA